MSKIYKALEKAEKERLIGLKKDLSFAPTEEGEQERKGLMSRSYSGKAGEMVWDPRMVCISQYASLAAEQFRKLRTHLLQIRIPEPLRTIMVTSANAGEGKTFVAANLAAGIATDLHAHAVLIECDLRSPVLTDLFNLPNSRGLSDYLLGERKISDVLMRTEVEKLTILPGGGIPDNPTELVGSKRMEALLYELKSRYDNRYVILDSPPLLMSSEPEVLSKLVDGILIVVRAGVTPRETIKQALSSIDKGKILGFVLNDLQFRSSGLSSRYFGSDGYYHKYGYGYYGRRKTKPQGLWKKLFL